MTDKTIGAILVGVLFLAPLLALFSAFLTAGLLCVPLMISLHFLHAFAPVVPALGWQASFWVLVVARLVFPGAGYSTSSDKD